jgi:hypothetical protein
MVEPTLGGSETRTLVVREDPKETLGITVEDAGGHPVHVYSTISDLDFEAEFLNTLNGDHAIRSTRPKPDASVDFNGMSCTYDGPTTFGPGRIDLAMANSSNSDLAVVVVAPIPGATLKQLDAFVDTATPDVQPPGLRPTGRVGRCPSGAISVMTPADLPEGRLAVVCFTEEPFFVQLVTGLEVAAA